MKYYGIDCQGKFNVQRISTLTPHVSGDEGRIVYDEERKKLWYGSDNEWKSFSDFGTVVTDFTNGDILFPDHIYYIDTTSSPLSGNLYNNAKNGDVVTVLDIAGKFSINAFTVATNGDLILQDTFFKCDTFNQIIQFIYSEIYGWKVDIGGLSREWADNVQYDNSASGLIATDVQGAIDEHVMSDNAHAASDLTYDPSSSGLAASNIQEAIDEEDIRIDALEDIVFAEEAATVSWNMETDTWSGDPKATAAHKALRRCIVDNTGAVQYYLDEYDSTLQEDGVTPANLDGTDGQVMVEIAPFYVRTAFNGHVATWSVSPEPLPGYVLHPTFDGGVLKSYVGAYDAIVYDTSAGAYINGLNLDNNTSRVALGEDMLASVATGNFPMVGLTRNEFRILAENAGFQLYDFWQWQAVMMLFVTEYGSWNSQAVLGRGNVDRSYVSSSNNQADSPHTAPGLSNVIGNGSGGIDDADGDPWVSYRGIENPWGNCWNFVDGWNIQDRQSYVSNDETSFADDTAVGYDAIGGLMPVAISVAIKNWQFVDNVFLVRTVDDGASTSAFVTDNFWTDTGWRVASVGGSAYDALLAGLACCYLRSDSADRNRVLGARLSKKLRS